MRASARSAIALLLLIHPSMGWTDTAVRQMSVGTSNVGSASLSQPVSAPTGFEINAQQGDSNVKLKVSKSLGYFKPNESDAKNGVGRGWALSATVQSPLDKTSSTSTTIGTLDGLSNATSVAFALTHVAVTGMRLDSLATDKYCKSVLKPKWLAEDSKRKESDFHCESGFIAKNMPEDYAAFRQYGFTTDSTITQWGLDAKVGYQDFSYFQESDLVKASTRKSPWSVGAFYYHVWPASNSLLGGSFKLQESYEDAKSQVVCPGNTASASIACVSGPIGTPLGKRKQLLSLEMRHYLASDLAISVLATHDFKGHVNGVQVPLYLIGNGTGGLTGGIRVDWASDTHKASVGVFVGQAFQLLE